MPFKDFKKNRSKFNEAFNKKVEELNSNPFDDDRFWIPTCDKAGNGSAVIRFLPAKDGEDVPFVRIFSHGFQGPGGWLVETCLTTEHADGKTYDCPVCKSNTELWNSDIAANKQIVSGTLGKPGRKRKLRYISNILVIKDKEHPENEGKVFLYSYGAKIFGKIEAAGKSEFEDIPSINPFDMWEGANFVLRIKNVEDYRNYDNSSFEKASQVDKSEAKMEEIYNQLYSLQEFVGPDKFKTFDELSAKLDKVLGNSTKARTAAEAALKDQKDPEPTAKTRTPRKAAEAVEPEPPAENDDPPFEVADGETSEASMEMFRKLAGD